MDMGLKHARLDQPPSRTIVQQSQMHQGLELTREHTYNEKDAVHQIVMHLKKLVAGNEIRRLEVGVVVGLSALTKLEQTLGMLGNIEGSIDWLSQVRSLREDASQRKTVIAVVGNTGAGKSSVINAMMDEERLLPTNCMRACTAVVTEISYNESNKEDAKYRACIEFVSAEDWRNEIEILFREFFDREGRPRREARDADSPAGIAYAKIRAVYRKMKIKDLANSTPEELMAFDKVASVLGTTKIINASNVTDFYQLLQTYVDSREKIPEQRRHTRPRGAARIVKRNIEYWPLIKVVKVYTKCEALSTGAIVVDLPGIQDSNAARAAVAGSYMKQCTGLWIIAPITRAVDDKAAKTLLGNSFKRQLKLDGSFSAVSFICSKTDDISSTEAIESLRLTQRLEKIHEELENCESKQLVIRVHLADAQGKLSSHSNIINRVNEDMNIWQDIQARLKVGEIVYAPLGTKRGHPSANSLGHSGHKKQKVNETSKSQRTSIASDSADDNIDHCDNSEAHNTPVHPSQAEEQIIALRQEQIEASTMTQDLLTTIAHLQDELNTIKERISELHANRDITCIIERNRYAQAAIRKDFASGIRELDQEIGLEEDDATFDPDEDERDYDQVAKSLPVFCVSSRAYQKLSGRLQMDGNVAGFKTKEQTQIPALQAHCIKLTEGRRLANSQRFLNSLNQLLSSLALWAGNDGTGIKLSNIEYDAELQLLKSHFEFLWAALNTAIDDFAVTVRKLLKEHIYNRFPVAIDAADCRALATVSRWGSRREDGGLHFQTFRAATVRNGKFASKAGSADFNGELVEPLHQNVTREWERVFQYYIPREVEDFFAISAEVLKKFESAIKEHCYISGHGLTQLADLDMSTHLAVLQDIATDIKEHINESQRDINREFLPAIATVMESAYGDCATTSGKGCFSLMKRRLADHIETHRKSMFQNACDNVRASCEHLVDIVRDEIKGEIGVVHDKIQRDYTMAVQNFTLDLNISAEELAIRKAADNDLTEIDALFRMILSEEFSVVEANFSEMQAGSDDRATDAGLSIVKTEAGAEQEAYSEDEEEYDSCDEDWNL